MGVCALGASRSTEAAVGPERSGVWFSAQRCRLLTPARDEPGCARVSDDGHLTLMAREVAREARGALRAGRWVPLKHPHCAASLWGPGSQGKCREHGGSGTRGRHAWAPVVSMVGGARGCRTSDSGGPQDWEGG